MDGIDDDFADAILMVLATSHYLDDVPDGHVVVVDLTGDRLSSRHVSPEEASRVVDPATAPGSVHPRLVPPDEFVAEAGDVGLAQDARQWPVLFTENGKPAAIAFIRSSAATPGRPPIGVVREWLERQVRVALAQATLRGWLHTVRPGEVIEINVSSNGIATTTLDRVERVLADVGRPSCERRDLDAWLRQARATALHPVFAFATVPGYDAPIVSLTFAKPDRRTSVRRIGRA